MKSRHKPYWAAFMLGLLLGASLVQARTWHTQWQWQTQARLSQLDAQHWRQESLRLRDQLAVINRKNERNTYVRTVNLEVLKSPVPLIDVEAALEPYTESLLGISLSSVKLSVVYHLLQDREIVLGEHLYKVDVKALLLSPDVTILLSLKPLRPSRSS